MFLGVVVSLVASGDHDFVDVLGMVLVLVDVFLDGLQIRLGDEHFAPQGRNPHDPLQ